MRRWLASPVVREVLAVAIVMAASLVIAASDMSAARERGIKPFFYQNYYEPAIRVACGQPFEIDMNGALSKDMLAFLKVERESLSCDAVQPSVNPNANPPTRIWYHLLVTVAAVWKISGISWAAIDGLAAFMLSLGAISVYGIFRLWMPAPIAIGLAVLSMLPGLKYLLFLRDLSKVPFILAALFVAALLGCRALSRGQLLTVMVAAGLWLGIGYGFRPDVLIGIPLIAVIAVFLRPGPVKENWAGGVLGAMLMSGAFVLAAAPLFSAFTSEVSSCHWHFSILGLSDAHTKLLGLQPGDISWLSHYDDNVLFRAVESYAERALSAPPVGYCSAMYDQVSKVMYLDSIATLPAEFLVRALAAAWHVIGFGFWGLPVIESGGPIGSLASEFRPVIRGAWLILWAAVVLTVLSRNVRLGLFACFSLAYLCAYPIVQFDTRHYFHLAFLTWIPVGLAVGWLWRCWGRTVGVVPGHGPGGGCAECEMPSRIAWLRAVAILSSIVAVGGATLLGARSYQERRVATLLDRYYLAPGTEAAIADRRVRQGNVRTTLVPVVPADGRRSTGRMLRLDLGGAGCKNAGMTLTLGVSGPDSGHEFTKQYTIAVASGPGMVTIFAPLYFERGLLDRVWMELQAADESCLVGARWLEPTALPALWLGAIARR